ncbi:MAG TPA: fibronectin type III domain-containing protein [Gemmatimonadales bacterium]|nr:fibronectin type III domain-containing protein [Gemmatimonadales bacterium]
MTCSTRSIAGWVLAAALAVAGCSDDNGSNSPTGLQPPTGLTVTEASTTSAHLSWTAASGATGYLVQRATSDNPTAFTALTPTPVTTTTYDDPALTSGVNYLYEVASVSASDTSAFTAPVSFSLGGGGTNAILSGPITTSRTLSADSVYTLSGYVKVQSGATLTIPAGTTIVGDTTQPGSSLWILRGAKIDAQGTATDPIVFTSARSPGNRKPGDWGGIIIIGNGIINRTGTPILTEGGAAGQAENYAGGTDNNDNSGTLRYVRIEFAGYDISGAGQELNSLSSYAVGRGTTYEFLQTMSGLDDSFEYWGGAVDGRYLVSYESGDDHYDWTEGYQGRNQFLIAFQSVKLVPAPGTGSFSADPRGFEGDGCDPTVSGCVLTGSTGSTPFSMPVWANFTLIGPGQNPDIPADGNGAVLRRGTGGTLFNGILGRWKGIAIDVRDTLTANNIVLDSLDFANLVLAQNGFNFDTAGVNFGDSLIITTASSNSIHPFASTVLVDTLLGINVTATSLDWTPKAGSPAATGGSAFVPSRFGLRTGGFFGALMPQTSYIGAADPAGTKWWQGWTAYNIN